MAPHMFIWPTQHNGTIGWPVRHNFPKVVLAGTMLTPATSDGTSTAQDLVHAQHEPHSQDDQCMRLRHTQTASAQLPWHYARTACVDQHTTQTTHMARLEYQQRSTWSTRGVPIAYA